QEKVGEHPIPTGGEVDASEVDLLAVQPTIRSDPLERFQIPDEHDGAPPVLTPALVVPASFLDGGEDGFHGRRYAQAVQLLLPGAGAEIIVHDDDPIHV